MTITAKVIAHSVSSLGGPALVTVKTRYPRMVHSELMTHRVFTRNASSSRAIPVERLIKDVMDDPAMPIHWGANQKGMSADAESNEPVHVEGLLGLCMTKANFSNREAWLTARNNAVTMARAFSEAGYHKQIVNRLLEPFCHITTLISSTQWSNFFALRCHPAAQPEMRALAEAIRDAIDASTPQVLKPGEWHLPFVGGRDDCIDTLQDEIKCSVARCARVSYETHEGKVPRVEEDLALYDRLVGGVPLHASPCEHQATPSDGVGWHSQNGGNLGDYWIQYRKTLPNEYL